MSHDINLNSIPDYSVWYNRHTHTYSMDPWVCNSNNRMWNKS